MKCVHFSVSCGLHFGVLPTLLVLLLSSCGTIENSPAESSKPAIDDRSYGLRQPEAPFRTVAAGDTLYSIAWESGRDYRTLATWNRISPPYTIKIGQQIRVRPPEVGSAEPENRKRNSEKKTGSIRQDNQQRKPVSPSTSGAMAKAGTANNSPKSASRLGAKNKTAARNIASKKNASPMDWAWPADGVLLSHAGDGKPKGLDIAGKQGSIVRAAASGRVVYQGSGLRGYGQLIIIKHSDEFLSAYAHNDRIYVKEGDLVKRGEKIADMGSSGTDRTKLHFEIRHRGIPADPLVYLPKR